MKTVTYKYSIYIDHFEGTCRRPQVSHQVRVTSIAVINLLIRRNVYVRSQAQVIKTEIWLQNIWSLLHVFLGHLLWR